MTALTEFNGVGTRATSQLQPARADQVKNNAGGYVFTLDTFDHFLRFLILGTEGGTYYVNQKDHTMQAVESMRKAFEIDGIRAVNLIVEVSTAGRAPKNDQALFALAYATSVADDDVRRYALSVLPQVARIGTHLFQFAEYVEKFRGWGRGLRSAVANWYETKGVEQVAYQAAKYAQRNGWSHRDLFRLSHPNMSHTPGTSDIAKFITHPDEYVIGDHTVPIVEGYIKARRAKSADELAAIIREYELTHDMIPTEFKSDPKVWNALLDVGIPTGALIRNLRNLTKYDILKPLGGGRTNEVVNQITNQDALKKARIHPVAILNALGAYDPSFGNSGYYYSQTAVGYKPVPEINVALEDAFHLAFGNVEPSNKRTLLGIDVSGSMSWSNCAGSNFTPAVGAAAMALVTVMTEPQVYAHGFTSKFTDLGINKRSTLNSVIKKTQASSFGSTDCNVPIQHALDNNLEVDTFVVYTDNETWAGGKHVFQGLKEYRDKTGIPARMVVVGMTSTGFTIADPDDAGMLDVVGFDTATPDIISRFSAGDI